MMHLLLLEYVFSIMGWYISQIAHLILQIIAGK
jgi:hypothetical protein